MRYTTPGLNVTAASGFPALAAAAKLAKLGASGDRYIEFGKKHPSNHQPATFFPHRRDHSRITCSHLRWNSRFGTGPLRHSSAASATLSPAGAPPGKYTISLMPRLW